MFKRDPKLPSILAAPTLSVQDKSQIVAELQRHTGGQDKSSTVKNFLDTLAENNRLSLLEGVCEKFGQLMGAARGELDLIITSAQVGRIGRATNTSTRSDHLCLGIGQEDAAETGDCNCQIRIKPRKEIEGASEGKALTSEKSQS